MALKIIITVIQLVCCVGLVLTVIFQSGSKQGLGTIGGMADTFMSKNKAKNTDVKLQKITVVLCILFVIATVALNIIALAD